MNEEEVLEDKENYQLDDEPSPRKTGRRFTKVQVIWQRPDHAHTKCIECGELAFGKPYCITHLDKMPYVSNLKKELELE